MNERSRQPGAPIRVVIDTDPGIDDVVALALAATSPELALVAVTTTYGNATLDACTRNAREALRRAGRPDVPVLPGASRPLRRPLVTAPETHGPTGVGHAAVPTPLPGDARPDTDVLLTVLGASSEPMTLVTLGPLTNLSHALTRDSALVRSRVARHIGMFGNLYERGNTNRWADFNAWADPEAAAHVLGAGLETVMVGLDVTRRIVLSAPEVEALATTPDGGLIPWLREALRFYVAFHRGQERLNGCVVNDPLTLGELIMPGLLTLAERRLIVDLDDGEHRGHTKEDDAGWPTTVALRVDVKRMRGLLDRVFGEGWHASER